MIGEVGGRLHPDSPEAAGRGQSGCSFIGEIICTRIAERRDPRVLPQVSTGIGEEKKRQESSYHT